MGRAKRYLLLRNNTQSGPYSYNELRKLFIRPSDLIWIQGESTSWSQPRFGSSNRAGAKRGQTRPVAGPSIPSYSGEQAAYAEPVSHPATGSFAAQPFYGPSRPGDNGFVQRDREAESEGIELIVHPSGLHSVSLSQLLLVATVTVACVSAWNNRFHFMRYTDENVTYARAAEVVQFEPRRKIKSVAAVAGVQDSGTKAPVAPTSMGGLANKSKKELPQRGSLTKKVKKTATKDTILVALPVILEKGKDVPPDTITPAPAPASLAPLPAEKKKTLGQALKNIFKKKKKKEGTPPDEQ